MKTETRTFYENAVHHVATCIAAQLDDALDLAALARRAALSPFHFHRVFRGMLGETPLELQRRLRMERAAWRILEDDAAITSIAFDAGYETHESFTRAFGQLYGSPPSAFRESALRDAHGCLQPLQFELAAKSGIHFRSAKQAEITIHFTSGDPAMNVRIERMPRLRVATIRHFGPYSRISEAFQKLAELAERSNLFAHPEARVLGIYHDDPESTPAAELRSDAAIVIPDDLALPEGFGEAVIQSGKYACTLHVGSYRELGDVWARLMGEWLPKSGERIGAGEPFELYLNNSAKTPEAELKTELYVPLA